MKAKNNISKLPKWAQVKISLLEFKVAEINGKLKQTESAHHLLTNPSMEWFTIGICTPEKRNLYFLDKDHPNHVATVGAGSFILIAHPKSLNQ
jgi:hypothetical protein